jgi:hypothetical protein
LKPIRRTIALLAAVTAIIAGSLVMADSPRVLIIGPSPKHPTVVRVRDELQVLGFEVELVTPGTGALDLAAIARERRAAAVVRVEAWPPEVIVWVDPARQQGEPEKSAEIRVSESLSGPVEPGLLALRAIELLRGKLIPVPPGELAEGGDAGDAEGTMDAEASTGDAATDAPSDARAHATPDASSLPAPSGPPSSLPRPRSASPAPIESGGPFSGILAGAALLSPGGVPAMPQIRLGVGWIPHPRLGLEGLVFFSVAPATISTPEGEIELRALGFGVGPIARLTDPAANLSATATVGIGAMLLLFEGSAPPPFLSSEGRGWTALPYVGAGLSYRLHPHLALRADTIAALALPEPVVRAAMREVASMGRPALLFSLGIEVRP